MTPAALPRGDAWRRLAPALLAVFVGALDLTVIATILPPMVADLGINTADIDRYVWIVNGYLLAYVVAIPIVGRVSDLIGRQAAFQASLALFLVGSVWCAAADDLLGLIVGRVIQGAGGGALLPVAMALVGDVLPPARRAGALGVVGAVDTLGWVLGPLWGAAVVGVIPGDQAWRWVFIVNVPLGALAALAIFRSVRGSRESGRGWLSRLDLVGTALLAAALLALNLGLSAGGELGGAQGGGRALGGTRNPLGDYLLPLLGGAFVLGVLLIWWERRAVHPVLPLGLFRRRRFAAAMGANALAGAALIVAMVDVPVVVALLVEPARVSAVSALMLAPFTLLMAALSLLGGAVAIRFGERRTAATGLVLVAVGYAVLWWGLRNGDYLGLLPGLALAGAGFGLVIAPIGAAVIDAAPAPDRGIAAGLTLVFRLLGMTIGISSLTAIGVRRLQGLTGDLAEFPRGAGESTAEFLARQAQFLQERVIPLSTQVVRETFLIAGTLALLALVPVWLMRERGPGPPRRDEPQSAADRPVSTVP
ncbi:MAG: MFS transporter [Chloroflexota bacterium]|nr:MFS transporter [Chloroflexota bacterium]